MPHDVEIKKKTLLHHHEVNRLIKQRTKKPTILMQSSDTGDVFTGIIFNDGFQRATLKEPYQKYRNELYRKIKDYNEYKELYRKKYIKKQTKTVIRV